MVVATGLDDHRLHFGAVRQSGPMEWDLRDGVRSLQTYKGDLQVSFAEDEDHPCFCFKKDTTSRENSFEGGGLDKESVRIQPDLEWVARGAYCRVKMKDS